MSDLKKIVIGSRKSILAKIQAYEVGNAISKKHPEIDIEFKTIHAEGDFDKTSALTSFSSTGIFTKTVTTQLINGTIDCAVHSWKDLPTLGEPETEIVATLMRADPRDILLLNKDCLTKSNLLILSSSPRREASIKEFLTWGLPWKAESVNLKPIRGNVDTRLAKLIEGREGDGLILAKAGLDRLFSDLNENQEFKVRIAELLANTIKIVLPLTVVPCAPGQGALAVEILKSNKELQTLLRSINHTQTFNSVNFEREFLKQKGGGCHSKLGAYHLSHPVGSIFFSQSADPHNDNLIIRENSFINHNLDASANSSTNKDELFSFKLLGIDTSRSKPLENVNLPDNAGVFVTKNSALPLNLKFAPEDSVVWASGVNTWAKLASQGILVNGCFDALGDKEAPQTTNLFPNIKSWVKLTNSQGNAVNWAQSIHTYRIDFSNIPQLNTFNHYFWSSFSEFDACLKKDPAILNKFHSCGTGSTYEKLAKIIPAKQLSVFLSHDEWLRHCPKIKWTVPNHLS